MRCFAALGTLGDVPLPVLRNRFSIHPPSRLERARPIAVSVLFLAGVVGALYVASRVVP